MKRILTLVLLASLVETASLTMAESPGAANPGATPRFLRVEAAKAEVFRQSEVPIISVSEIFPDLYQGDDIVGQIMAGDSVTITAVSIRKGVRSAHHNHASEEFVTVIKGKVRVHSDGDQYVLEAGDSVRFPSFVPHQVEALQDSDLLEAFGPPGNPANQ